MIKSVKELTGTELDYAVGKAQGWINYPSDSIECGDTWHCDASRAPFGPIINLSDYSPTKDAYQCLKLVKEFSITIYAPHHLHKNEQEPFGAQIYIVNNPHVVRGRTLEEAVCRCFVISKGITQLEIPAYVKVE